MLTISTSFSIGSSFQLSGTPCSLLAVLTQASEVQATHGKMWTDKTQFSHNSFNVANILFFELLILFFCHSSLI